MVSGEHTNLEDCSCRMVAHRRVTLLILPMLSIYLCTKANCHCNTVGNAYSFHSPKFNFRSPGKEQQLKLECRSYSGVSIIGVQNWRRIRIVLSVA